MIALTLCAACTISLHTFFIALDNIESPPGMPIPYPADHIGNFQISYAYWLDSNTPGKWEDCLDDGYSKRVMLNYWRRYTPEALRDRDFEILARTHYGGPNGAKKENTEMYWGLVEKEIRNKK